MLVGDRSVWETSETIPGKSAAGSGGFQASLVVAQTSIVHTDIEDEITGPNQKIIV